METFLLAYMILLVFVAVTVMIMAFISMYRQKKGLKKDKMVSEVF